MSPLWARCRCGLSFSLRIGSLKESRPTHLCAAVRLDSGISKQSAIEAGLRAAAVLGGWNQQPAWEQSRDIDGKHLSSATIRLESARRQGSLVFGKNRLMDGLHRAIMSEEGFRFQLVGHLGRDSEIWRDCWSLFELFKQVPAQLRVRLFLLPTVPLLRFDFGCLG